MSTAEQMQIWRDSVGTSAPAEQSATATFTSATTGTFNQADAFMFGYSFINAPALAYSVELDDYDPTDATAVVSTGYTYGWVTDDQGLYIGAYIGARVTALSSSATATHRFNFRELAVKNALY